MSFASILSLLSALILSVTVLSAGIARLSSPITPEQIVQERRRSSINTSTLRELHNALGDSEQKVGRSNGICTAGNGAGLESERGKVGGEGSDMYGAVYNCVDMLN
ncbi:MAG: hypothetical protein Q9175_002104 [Cornicularia normoerica]